jgi:hypothetical protein
MAVTPNLNPSALVGTRVSRSQLADLCRALGHDPSMVGSISIDADCIDVECLDVDAWRHGLSINEATYHVLHYVDA